MVIILLFDKLQIVFSVSKYWYLFTEINPSIKNIQNKHGITPIDLLAKISNILQQQAFGEVSNIV